MTWRLLRPGCIRPQVTVFFAVAAVSIQVLMVNCCEWQALLGKLKFQLYAFYLHDLALAVIWLHQAIGNFSFAAFAI